MGQILILRVAAYGRLFVVHGVDAEVAGVDGVKVGGAWARDGGTASIEYRETGVTQRIDFAPLRRRLSAWHWVSCEGGIRMRLGWGKSGGRSG